MRRIASVLICIAAAFALASCNNGSGGGGGGGSASGGPGGLPDAMDLGNPNAKVTVNEFASLGCPICAKWNNEVFQSFKAKYIDTGKVHYVFHEFLVGDMVVAGNGFLLARCAGKDKYFQVADAVFRQEQPYLETDQNAAKSDALKKIAESMGMTDAQFQACVGNDDAVAALKRRSDAAADQYHVESTPTFMVNGKSYVGYQDMAAMDKMVADAGGS
jgi:protein-disulfide isomerase